jgi:hypothetical protein
MVGSVRKSTKMLYNFELYMCIFDLMLKYTSLQFQRNLRFANQIIFEQVTTFEVFETMC